MSLSFAGSGREVDERGDAPLRFDAVLPREVVHKSAASEVFVTDSRQLDGEHFALAGLLPSSHAFYNDTVAAGARLDVMALVELGRQSAYVVGHRHLGIPVDAKYVVRSLGASLVPELDGLELPQPTPVLLAFRVLRTFGPEGVVTGFELAVEFSLPGGGPIGAFWGSCSWMPPPAWRALRVATREELGLALDPQLPGRDPETVPASEVGRSVAGNAVLARPRRDGDAVLAELTPDPSHVPLFDHAHHHVPGVVQVEGARQLAIWGAARMLGVTAAELEPRRLTARFGAVAEFDLSTRMRGRIVAAPDGSGACAQVELLQRELVIGASEVEVAVRRA